MYSLNAVAPIVILVLLGVILKKTGMVNDAFTAVSEKVVFKVALPVMLFLEVAQSSLSEALDLRLIGFCLVSVTAAFLTVTFLTPLFIRERGKCGSFIQGACRSNFAILGVPLAENLFGDSGTACIAIVMPFVILMFNVYSVIILSVFSNSHENRLDIAAVKGILKNIVTNPLIISVILALPFLIWQWEIPAIPLKSLVYLKNLTTPLALICLGANFRLESMKGRAGTAVASTLIKTVFLPAVMVILAALFGLRNESLGVILILFGAPTAVSSYIMAKNMDNDHELAAQILLFTTILCAFTIFTGIFVLKNLNLI